MYINKIFKSRYVNKNGFTLLELVIATMLILIISISFLNFIVSALKARAVAKGRLTAMSIAVEIMEEITSYQGGQWHNVSELEKWITSTKGFSKTQENNTYLLNNGNFEVFLEIDKERPKKQDGTSVDGLFEVTIIVKYDNDSEVSLLSVFREV